MTGVCAAAPTVFHPQLLAPSLQLPALRSTHRQLLAPLQRAHCVAELVALAEVAAEEALLLLLARVHVAPLVHILVTLQAKQSDEDHL